jgi:hypothetical protein
VVMTVAVNCYEGVGQFYNFQKINIKDMRP